MISNISTRRFAPQSQRSLPQAAPARLQAAPARARSVPARAEAKKPDWGKLAIVVGGLLLLAGLLISLFKKKPAPA